MELDADRVGIIMAASAGYNYKIAPASLSLQKPPLRALQADGRQATRGVGARVDADASLAHVGRVGDCVAVHDAHCVL